MRTTTTDLLICPTCGSTNLRSHSLQARNAARIETGFVYCDRRHWFPIEHEVLELLAPSLMYRDDRDRFARRYESALGGLGLAPDDAADGVPDPEHAETVAAVQAQQQHFDWYAENDAQSYDEYSRMPFWEAVDRMTFGKWKQLVAKAYELSGDANTPAPTTSS